MAVLHRFNCSCKLTKRLGIDNETTQYYIEEQKHLFHGNNKKNKAIGRQGNTDNTGEQGT